MIRRTTFAFILSCVLLISANAQDNQNLIPNPGFEELNFFTSKWFYTGEDFTQAMKFWSSPTYASPDIYGPQILIPKSWKDRGFGEMKAHSGNYCVGLTLYGCTNGKAHCKEFIQVRLNQALVPKQTYQIEFYVSRMDKTLAINKIGISFIEERLLDLTDSSISANAQIYVQDVLDLDANMWRKVIFQFKATSDSKYILIGNFSDDYYTQFIKRDTADYNYAYYYFDDIKLTKTPPYLEPEDPFMDPFRPIEKGSVFELKQVYFDYNDKDFLPSSNRQLDQLVTLLYEFPEMIIKIEGHTDSRGTDEYNAWLSIERASAVRKYLLGKGIASDRIEYEGYGSSQPKSKSRFHENRRVEFRILRVQ